MMAWMTTRTPSAGRSIALGAQKNELICLHLRNIHKAEAAIPFYMWPAASLIAKEPHHLRRCSEGRSWEEE